jgi:uncharacterized protein (TIGR03435 family)
MRMTGPHMFVFACGIACAQGNPPAFEVASVKVSTDERGAYVTGGPGSKDPTQFTGVRIRMGALLRMAYGIDSYQLSAPAGLTDGYFDIRAKIPPNTGEPQFEQMLQNLLVERFAMKVRHETRGLAGYELVVPKGGLKMKTAQQTATPPAADIPVARLPLTKDRAGEPELPPGRNARRMVRLSDGRFRQTGRMQTMADIVAMCQLELGRPVIDRSGLTGVYDFNVDFMRVPDGASEPADDAALPFLTAFQSQLGLRLESRKVPVDVVVIDHIEKIPTEN